MLSLSTPEEFANLLRLKIPSEKDIDNPNLRFVIYARKSTDEEGKQVHSVEDQVAVCEDFAKKNDIRVVHVLKEKMSAKEPDVRPVFREMLNGLKSGKYDAILAWHPDRLARNMKEAGEVIDLLDKGTIVDLKFPSFSFTNDTSGKMLLGITFVLSKEYSDKLSDDVSRGNEKSLERGSYVNKAKHGYIKDKFGRLVPDGENFLLLKRAFDMRLDGKTLKDICDYLNENNYFHRNTELAKRYYGMTESRLMYILKDPVYTGILNYGGKVIINLIETQEFIPMITVEEFMRINKLTNDKQLIKLARTYKRQEDIKADLMRGCIICDECGEEMTAGITGKTLKNGSTGYFYYRCDTPFCC